MVGMAPLVVGSGSSAGSSGAGGVRWWVWWWGLGFYVLVVWGAFSWMLMSLVVVVGMSAALVEESIDAIV